MLQFDMEDVERLLKRKYFTQIGVRVEKGMTDRVKSIRELYPLTEMVEFM